MSEMYFSQYKLNFNDELDNQYENIEVNYKTQTSLYVGFGMSFYRFGFAFSYRLPYTNIPDLKKEQAFSFSGGYSYKHFYGELKIKKYQGVQEEIIRYDNDTTITTIIVNQGIETRQVGLNLYYFSSDKYNFDANFKNYNTQKKTATSFILGGGLNYYNFSGELDLNLKQEIAPNYKKDIDVKTIKFMPGIATSLVYNNFYFSTMTLMGGAYNYNTLDYNEIRHNFSPIVELRAVLGYNNRNLFTSINLNYDYDLVFLRQNKLGVHNFMVNMKLGIKLNSKYLGKIGRYL